MVQSTASSPCIQFQSLRQRLEQEDGLPFLKLLSRTMVSAARRRINHQWRERIYTPWITLGMFVSQVLAADQSCDQAVDRLHGGNWCRFIFRAGVACRQAGTRWYPLSA